MYRALKRTGCCRNVIQSAYCLSGNDPLLHASADTESIDSLETDPHGMARADFEGGY